MGWVGLSLYLGGVGFDFGLVLDLGFPGIAFELSWIQLDLELHVGLGFGRRLQKDWAGLHFGVSWVWPGAKMG